MTAELGQHEELRATVNTVAIRRCLHSLTRTTGDRLELICSGGYESREGRDARPTVRACIPLPPSAYTLRLEAGPGRAIVHRFGARDILIAPSPQAQTIHWRPPTRMVSLQISERMMAKVLGLESWELRDPVCFRDSFVSSAASELFVAFHNGDCPNALFVDAMITAITCRLGLNALSAKPLGVFRAVAPLSPRQQKLVETYVDARLDAELPLRRLASLVRMSAWHFIRRFRAHYGVSPHEFVTHRRMATARRLLGETQLPVTEVALRVGMNPSHFSRTFSKNEGATPREYRQRVQS